MDPTIFEIIEDANINGVPANQYSIALSLISLTQDFGATLDDPTEEVTFLVANDDDILADLNTAFGLVGDTLDQLSVILFFSFFNDSFKTEPADESLIDALIGYHLVEQVFSASLNEGDRLETAAGQSLRVGDNTLIDKDPDVGDAASIGELDASNGDVVFVDGFLFFGDFFVSADGAAIDRGFGRGVDIIFGSSEDDSVRLGRGDDWASIAEGDNTIKGGRGDDHIAGGADDDRLLGGKGDDKVTGAEGADVLSGGDGDDTLAGGDDNDSLLGDADGDLLLGQDGLDTLSGGGGADTLDGGADADNLAGGKGRDELRGGDGDDQITGAKGRDLIIGGLGDDTMSGGAGADRFQFDGAAVDEGDDVITGFKVAADKVEFAVSGTPGSIATTAANAGDPDELEYLDLLPINSITSGEANGNLLLSLITGATIELVGVSPTLTDAEINDFVAFDITFL